MTYLLLGVVVFFGLHSIAIVAPAARDRLAARLGEGPWKTLYSVISLAGFLAIIHGFGVARPTSALLYTPPAWLHPVALVLLVPVFPFLFAAYLPGRIQAAVKHPLLEATKAWALAHLLVNGALVDVIVFGAFLAWAVLDSISLKRRAPRAIRTAPPGRFNDLIAVVLGLAVYAALLLGLHARLFGVNPLG